MDLKEEFKNLTAGKSLLVGVLFGALYYFMLFNDGSRIDARTAVNEEQIQTHKVTLDKVQKALEDEKRFNKEIREITSHMDAFLEYFPIRSDKSELMKIISTKAEDHDAILNSLKPIKQKAEFPDYPEMAFSFSVEGDFHEVMGFISELTQLKRVVDFRKMKFKVVKRDDKPRVELTTIFIVYSNKENGGSSG